VDAAERPSVRLELALHPHAGRQDERVEVPAQIGGRHVGAHLHPAFDPDPLGAQDVEPALDDPLLELEVGHAEAQQAAGRLVALENRDLVAALVQLGRDREAGRARAHHRHAAPAAFARRSRHDPALGDRALDDGPLDLLDHHRVVVDLERARRLARRRADQPGELREVVRLVQPVDRGTPLAVGGELVPVGDEVADGAGVVAERHAAAHAASRLAAQLLLGQGPEDLAVVGRASERVADRLGRARRCEESARVAHQAGTRSRSSCRSSASR
jgi:hypothetical protein